ncbi:MAG: hypothetical protein Q8N16_01625 [bacterium]|nr:hypothetical protein [bacterium]
MTKRTRTFLFLICLAIFLVVSPAVIFYSQGYRFDFKSRKLTKTGAFYFKTQPKSCEVFINGKPIKEKTDFLFGTILVENLLPGRYPVEIKKGGYLPWKKNLDVEATMTTEAKNIVLFPENISFQILTTGTESIFSAPSARKTILKKRDSQGWYLTVLNLESNFEELLIREKDLRKKTDFLNLEWSNDSRALIIKASLGEQEKFFFVDTEKKPASPISLDYLGSFDKIGFDPQDSRRFIFLRQESLFSGGLASKETLEIAKKVVDFESGQRKLYILENTGFVFEIDNLAIPKKQVLQETPFEIKLETPYSLEVSRKNVFLGQEDRLFWFDEKTRNFAEVGANIKGFAVSQDETKLIFYNNSEAWVYFLKDKADQPARKYKDSFLLARMKDQIGQVLWLDNDHVLFSAGNKLRVIEIDNRDQTNFADIGEFNNPEIFFNSNSKKALVLTEGNLYISSAILP